jgi:hypothetical protein
MLRSLTVILRFSLCDWSAADAVMATSSQEIDPAPPADRPPQPADGCRRPSDASSPAGPLASELNVF